jgi:hypothetical protein
MALVADRIDYYEVPAPYVEKCPEDWWKRGETFEYTDHSFSNADESPSQPEKDFNRLAKKWKNETSGYSSAASMVMHPAYLEIISYGEKMIPYILKDLQQKPSHWFIALKTLAKNYSPVKPEDAGNIKKMTEAWIEWGRKNGKLS